MDEQPPSPLHPDLWPYDDPDEEWVDHPLVTGPSGSAELAEALNKEYLAKLGAVYKEVRKRDWFAYLSLHRRRERFVLLKEVASAMADDKTYWQLVRMAWTDSENIHQNLAGWRKLWNAPRAEKQFVMEARERKKLAQLPESFTIWRGVRTRHKSGDGMSWTLDREKAIWFAKRFASATAMVLEARAAKANVHALFESSEREIVISQYEITSQLKVGAST